MIAQFALRLICGMSLIWALMPRRQVTSGFFRIQMLVVMGMGVLAILTTSKPIGGTISMQFCGVAGFVGSSCWALGRRTAGEWIGFGVLGASILDLTFGDLTTLDSVFWTVIRALSQVANAALLGSTMVGMLLGHWYLTAPTMSIQPLKRVNLLVGFAGF